MKSFHHDHVLKLEDISASRLEGLDRAKTVIIATFSPLEVHGPHLPLGQDIFEAYSFAEAVSVQLAEAFQEWTFVLMAPFPMASDTVPMLGSVEFPPRLVAQTAYHALAPFARAGFGRLAISSFHGGPRHILALEQAADRVTREFKTPAVSMFSMMLGSLLGGKLFHDALGEEAPLSPEQFGKDQHAAFVETSLGLYLWPELVEEGWADLPERVTETLESSEGPSSVLDMRMESSSLGRTMERLSFMVRDILNSMRHFEEHSYHGTPAPSSGAHGERLFNHLRDLTAKKVETFLQGGLDFDGHSPLWPYRHLLMNPLAEQATKRLSKRARPESDQ